MAELYTLEMENVLSRFLDNVEDYDSFNNCWIWKGVINNAGYSRFSWKGRHWLAHRWIYLYCYGKLERKLVIDHLCGVTVCVNPIHLEQVTPGENIRRAYSYHPTDAYVAKMNAKILAAINAKEEARNAARDLKQLVHDLYYVERYTMPIVASKLGISRYRVSNILKELGYKKTRHTWTG